MTPSTPLSAEETLRAQLGYIGQLLWLISAQLHAMTGGGDYPIPDAQSVAGMSPAWPEPGDILARLKGGPAHDP